MNDKKIKFEEFALSEEVKKALQEYGYQEATSIQQQSIPVLLEGKDIIGQSKTGTGKTASYSLPMIEKITVKDNQVQAIILCPTRELAMQVSEEMKKFTKYKKQLKFLAVYGGQSIETQIRELKRGVHIVIGTPGRVLDHMRRKTLNLNAIKMVVLDEADEMLNMGFEEDMEAILKETPKERQTALFSATMNPRILKIAKKYLVEPKTIKIPSEELTVNNIEQITISMKQAMKNVTLMRLIEVYHPQKAIVFCNTKRKVDDLVEVLKSNGYLTEAIHGDMKQSQRERIMKNMKKGDFQILVATDVVARGIDIQQVELVVNYDIPQEEEYYVHRIGRTGRNGEKGKAITFVVGKETRKMLEIKRYSKAKMKEGKIPTLEEIHKIKQNKMVSKIEQVIQEKEFSHLEILDELLEKYEMKEIAQGLLTLVCGKETKTSKEVSKKKNEAVKLFFNLGKKDDIKVKDFVGSISANCGISGSDIGKVNLLDKFTFVEIPSQYVTDILEGMKGKQIKGKDCKVEIANG